MDHTLSIKVPKAEPHQISEIITNQYIIMKQSGLWSISGSSLLSVHVTCYSSCPARMKEWKSIMKMVSKFSFELHVSYFLILQRPIIQVNEPEFASMVIMTQSSIKLWRSKLDYVSKAYSKNSVNISSSSFSPRLLTSTVIIEIAHSGQCTFKDIFVH